MRQRLVLLVLLLLPGAAMSASLWETVDALRNDVSTLDADTLRRAQVRALMASVTGNAIHDTLPIEGAPEDWVRSESSALSIDVRRDFGGVVLGSATGEGLYVIRLGTSSSLILQAPHAWSDLHTGAIVGALFEAGFGQAACFATAHRGTPMGEESSSPLGGTDVAHLEASLFTTATLGIADALADPLVVQIHGFAPKHGSYAAVVSGGSAIQSADLVPATVTRLGALLADFGPVVDGSQVPALAAVTNIQSQSLAGKARFLHLELSFPLRTALARDADLRARLGQVLQDLAERRP